MKEWLLKAYEQQSLPSGRTTDIPRNSDANIEASRITQLPDSKATSNILPDNEENVESLLALDPVGSNEGTTREG
jgi:hypothetical protein